MFRQKSAPSVRAKWIDADLLTHISIEGGSKLSSLTAVAAMAFRAPLWRQLITTTAFANLRRASLIGLESSTPLEVSVGVFPFRIGTVPFAVPFTVPFRVSFISDSAMAMARMAERDVVRFVRECVCGSVCESHLGFKVLSNDSRCDVCCIVSQSPTSSPLGHY